MKDLDYIKKINSNEIKKLIYCVRGTQVMLDRDVAMLYHYETKNINKAMKRNIERFPEDFCFRLNKKELEGMWFQNGTTFEGNNMKYRSEQYLPYVYTEQGISMLAGILKNDVAVEVSIKIIRAFIELRKILLSNGHIFERLTNVEYKLLEHDKKFDEIFNEFKHEESITYKIFFEGQIWDSYNLIIDLIKKAQTRLIIDNYINDSILKMLSKKKKNDEVVILTSSKSDIQRLDIQKFNKEYPTLKIAKTEKFHDRFIILDERELYHCGASLKDLGNKCFGINKIEDKEVIKSIIKVYNG